MAVNTAWRTNDKHPKKFIHSAEVQLSGRKINTNLMRGCKANSAAVLSTQGRAGERKDLKGGRGEEEGETCWNEGSRWTR